MTASVRSVLSVLIKGGGDLAAAAGGAEGGAEGGAPAGGAPAPSPA